MSERFKLDEPSGVYKNPIDIKIDGAAGKQFFSQNTDLGDTVEVWP